MKINEIMTTMENRVLNDEPVSPASWVESAIRVNQLVGSLDNEIIAYEAELINIEAEYLKEDMSSSKSKTLAKSQINYKDYLEKKAERIKITEFIRLAKNRSRIEEI